MMTLLLACIPFYLCDSNIFIDDDLVSKRSLRRRGDVDLEDLPDHLRSTMPKDVLENIYFQQINNGHDHQEVYTLMRTNRNLARQVLQSRHADLADRLKHVLLYGTQSHTDGDVELIKFILEYPKLVSWNELKISPGSEHIFGMEDLQWLYKKLTFSSTLQFKSDQAHSIWETYLVDARVAQVYIQHIVNHLDDLMKSPLKEEAASLLHWTIEWSANYDMTDLTRQLIENPKSAHIIDTDSSRAHALSAASFYGQKETVKYLLEKPMLPIAYDAAFVCASAAGSIDVLKMLLEHNLPIEELTPERCLVAAWELGNWETIKTFLRNDRFYNLIPPADLGAFMVQ